MSLIEYHKTTNAEIVALSNKVRNLIDHWGEEGRYKEAVLKNVIRRFLPKKYMIASGFVIRQTEIRGEHISSRQMDLLIYDNESPVVFEEGDFVILTPDSVRAIIEVKANLKNQGISKVVEQANANGRFVFEGKENKHEPFFNGIFSFDGDDNLSPNTFAGHVLKANGPFADHEDFELFKVNHIAYNKNWFMKYWPEEVIAHSLYRLNDLTFSFFISNLIDILANQSVGRNKFKWFANDKELNLVSEF